MNEYLTKADLTAAINQHELDAAKRQKEISEKEQRLRHDQWSRFQREIISMDDKQTKIYDKVESNDIDLALLKQSQLTMTEKVHEIKKEMKEGFSSIENKMEVFLLTMKKEFVTKSEHAHSSKRLDNLEKWIWGIISVILVWILWAILKLILI